MELEVVELPKQNKIIDSYMNDPQFLHTFFDYEYSQAGFASRLHELQNRTFQRQPLATVIQAYMEPFGISSRAQQHINELAKDAVAVVGGQQAGILTGPLYSLHKAITVILLAKKQRAELEIPVVPIFWIAGEDHDLNEINHVYTANKGIAYKNQYKEQYIFKSMASETKYNQKQMTAFICAIFEKFGETAHTKALLDHVLHVVHQRTTFTELFTDLMNGLFQEEGLLFVDSAFPPLRQLESPYFAQFIHESASIAEAVYDTERQFDNAGYGMPIGATEEAAHLFYVHETGRLLLTRDADRFINDSIGLQLSKEELLQLANEQPSLLSNNVVTRPLMQDMVIPVLAFVGGPGEIAYWALLKKAFHQLDVKMPVLVPRMSITFVLPKVQRALKETGLTVEQVMAGEAAVEREQFLATVQDDRIEEWILDTERIIKRQYETVQQIGKEISNGLPTLIDKNLHYHIKQLQYVKKKFEEAILTKHESKVQLYLTIEEELDPEGLQERKYTPYSYLNAYGPTLVTDLLSLPFQFDAPHQIIYL